MGGSEVGRNELILERAWETVKGGMTPTAVAYFLASYSDKVPLEVALTALYEAGELSMVEKLSREQNNDETTSWKFGWDNGPS